MRQFKAEIIGNKKVAKDHYVLSFKAHGVAKKTKPGQFFNIRITDSCEPFLRRPFGAYKIDKDKIEILYKVVGKATTILSRKKTKDVLDIIGPLGNGFTLKTKAILVGGGHGVAPLYALAAALGAKSGLEVYIGARTAKQIVCDKDFKKLGAKVYVATEDGSKGYKGVITELLNKKPSTIDHRPSTIYACGPKPMLKEVARLSVLHKISCQVSLEEYMACGIGTCLGCAVKTKKGYKMVCKDGPVFDAKEIIW